MFATFPVGARHFEFCLERADCVRSSATKALLLTASPKAPFVAVAVPRSTRLPRSPSPTPQPKRALVRWASVECLVARSWCSSPAVDAETPAVHTTRGARESFFFRCSTAPRSTTTCPTLPPTSFHRVLSSTEPLLPHPQLALTSLPSNHVSKQSLSVVGSIVSDFSLRHGHALICVSSGMNMRLVRRSASIKKIQERTKGTTANNVPHCFCYLLKSRRSTTPKLWLR